MSKSREYWLRRFKLIEQACHDISLDYLEEMEKKYRDAEQTIQAKINAWYGRFADNNNISMSEARKWLNDKELDELKWNVEQYIQYGKQNAIDGKWAKELENASAKFHISRLEALKLECRQQIEQLTGGMTDDVDAVLQDTYREGYYRSLYEVQKGVAVGFDVAALDKNLVKRIVNKPWHIDGSDFSSSIWSNKAKLLGVIDKEISKMVLTGSSPEKTIRAIQNQMHTSKSNAQRLVLTESAFFTTRAQADSYGELGVELYEVVGTLDKRTCDFCGSFDGKKFPVAEMEVGVNAPPFHPRCRCTTCPYDEDSDVFGVGTRAARDENGKTVTVPGDMTFEEWKKKFVGNDKTGLQEVEIDDTIKSKKTSVEQVIQHEPVVERVYKELTEDEFKEIKQPITKAERKIIYGKTHFSGYINSSNARKMNALLREDKELPANYREIEVTLKGVIGRYKLPDDLLVTRYVTNDALEGMFGVSVPKYKLSQKVDDFWEQIEDIPNQLGSDRVYIEKGFLSTSGVSDKNVMTDKAIKMIIKAPKGTPSYVTTNYKESEIIFNENTTLHLVNSYIENPRKAGWKIVLECEIR